MTATDVPPSIDVPGTVAPGTPSTGAPQLAAGDVTAPRHLLRHALALLLVLLVVSITSQNGVPAIADEGAVLAQVDHVAGRSWTDPASWRIDRPFPDSDPQGEMAPLDHSQLSGDQYLPYSRHPLYPAVLLPAWNLAGGTGAAVFSALAVWCAALTGAAITRRLRPRLTTIALWALGLATPLLFDATVVMAHAAAAALLGALVLCLLRHLERPRWSATIGAIVCSAPLVMVRGEGLLVMGAVVTALVVTSVRSWRPATSILRSIDARTFVLAAALAFVSIVTYLADARLYTVLAGETGVTITTTAGDGYDLIGGRLSALWASVLRPTHEVPVWGAPVTLLSTVLLIAAGITLRVSPTRRRLVVAFASAAAVLAVVRQLAPLTLVSGLIPAAPLLVVGLVFLRRSDLRSVAVRLCLGISVLTAGAIWITSYPQGGAFEWGGRYFHVLLPLLVPVALVGLERAVDTLGADPSTPCARRRAIGARQVVVVAALVVTASLSLLSIRTVHALRDAHARTVATALASADAAAPAADGGTPVLISDARPIGRLAWSELSAYRIVHVPDPDLVGPLLDDLAEEQIGTVTLLVSPFQELPPEAAEDWIVVEERGDPDVNMSYVELRQR